MFVHQAQHSICIYFFYEREREVLGHCVVRPLDGFTFNMAIVLIGTIIEAIIIPTRASVMCSIFYSPHCLYR